MTDPATSPAAPIGGAADRAQIFDRYFSVHGATLADRREGERFLAYILDGPDRESVPPVRHALAAPAAPAPVCGLPGVDAVQSVDPVPSDDDVAAVLKAHPDARSNQYGPGGLWPESPWAVLIGVGDTLRALARGKTAAEAWEKAARLTERRPAAAGSDAAPGRVDAGAVREAAQKAVSAWLDHEYGSDSFADAMGELKDALALAAALDRAGDGWRPIETAPKDGTYILGFGPHEDRGSYIDAIHWWSGHWTITWMTGFGAPTHWRPLPAPPTSAQPSTVTP